VNLATLEQRLQNVARRMVHRPNFPNGAQPGVNGQQQPGQQAGQVPGQQPAATHPQQQQAQQQQAQQQQQMAQPGQQPGMQQPGMQQQQPGLPQQQQPGMQQPQPGMQQQPMANGYPPQAMGGYAQQPMSAPMRPLSSAQQAHPMWSPGGDAGQQPSAGMLPQQQQQQAPNGYPPASGGMAPLGGNDACPTARLGPSPGPGGQPVQQLPQQQQQSPGPGMLTPKLEPGGAPDGSGGGQPPQMANGQMGGHPQVGGPGGGMMGNGMGQHQQLLPPPMSMGHNGGMPMGNGMMRGHAAAGSAVMSNGVPVLRSSRAAAGPWTATQAPPMVQNVRTPCACAHIAAAQPICMPTRLCFQILSPALCVCHESKPAETVCPSCIPTQACEACRVQGTIGQQRMMNGMAPGQMGMQSGIGAPLKLEKQQYQQHQYPQMAPQQHQQQHRVSCWSVQ